VCGAAHSSIACQKSRDGFVVPAPCILCSGKSWVWSACARLDTLDCRLVIASAFDVPVTSSNERRFDEMTYCPAPICGIVLSSLVNVGMPVGVVIDARVAKL
jgi:hypothetical protein